MKTGLHLTLLWLLVATGMGAQQRYAPEWESIDSRPIPNWFTDAKFGIFIHWGLFSVPAWGPLPADGAGIYDCYAEWYWAKLMDTNNRVNPLFTAFHKEHYGADFAYQDFVKDFRCELFRPDDWASLFKASGARYVVLTSKHHEGFTLWPSAQAWNWNAVDVGPHRDLAGELSQAVKQAGLHFGFYYSLYEWFNPLYKSDVARYVDEHMLPQMKDLVTRYQPDLVWTDGEWDHPSEVWRSTDFLAWLYNESAVKSSVVVNDRWGKETRGKHGGFYTTEYGQMHEADMSGQRIFHPWEECQGMGHSFGYNRNENLSDYTSSAGLIHLLIEKVALGGNLLLNIGPTADGRIPVIMQQRLSDIGRWLEVNGEAIYSTSPWETSNRQEDINAYFTVKGHDLYVICTQFPGQSITIRQLPAKPSSVTLLGSNVRLSYSQSGGNLRLSPPAITPANTPCEHAWVFKLANVF